MNKRELLLEKLPEGEFLCADGLDEAIVGFEESSQRVIYDIDKCIEIIAKNIEIGPEDVYDDMTEEDTRQTMAAEDFYFNTAGAYVGPQTPIFIRVIC
jgi:hypothetical protein